MTIETRLFAYGTLKQGLPAHARLCRGVLAVATARVWGRLFELPAGYPALVVPDHLVIDSATLAPDEDQRCLATAAPRLPAPRARSTLRPVLGHLITFGDYRTAWPPLDAWEEARPDRPSLYRRVLVGVEVDGGPPATAWTYVVPMLPEGVRELAAGEWPAPAVLPLSSDAGA